MNIKEIFNRRYPIGGTIEIGVMEAKITDTCPVCHRVYAENDVYSYKIKTDSNGEMTNVKAKSLNESLKK